MKMHGGKHRLAKGIVDAMMPALENAQLYVEPFIGGASVLVEVRKRFPTLPAIAADVSEDLILLWKAVQDGWVPPTTLTYEEYQLLRYDPVPSALRGFAGYGCSFAGGYFEGYARYKDNNYADTASRGLMKKAPHLAGVQFLHADFAALDLPRPAVIYADPPYQGTKPYSRMPKWEPDRFWQQVDLWREQGHTVFVSEFAAPPGYNVVWEKDRAVAAGHHKGKGSKPWKTDRLYRA